MIRDRILVPARHSACALSIAILCLTVFPAYAGINSALPHNDLRCSRELSSSLPSRIGESEPTFGKGKSLIRIEEGYFNSGIYRAAPKNLKSGIGTILFNFDNARRAPSAILKIEYAIACLQVLGVIRYQNDLDRLTGSDVCDAVGFLRSRDYYSPRDVAEIEDLLFEGSPKHRGWIDLNRWTEDALVAAIKCY